jgi:hypothetical protein
MTDLCTDFANIISFFSKLKGNLSDPTKLIKAFRVEKILDKGVSITSGGSSLDECIVANRPSLMDEHWICYPDSCMASNLSAVAQYVFFS